MVHIKERSATEALGRVERWFSRKTPDPSRPLFLWVHFFDPHAEYRAPAPWALCAASLYDAEVAHVDLVLRRLLRLLRQERPGRIRRIVVASDHGESLGEHGETTHGVLLHSATLRVPIVVRREGYAPRLRAAPVPLESIARTLLDLAGVKSGLPAAAAAPVESFDGPVHAETLYPAFNFGWRGLRAREEDGWKLVLGAGERLYRITTDPAEARDVAAEHPDVVERLVEAIHETWARESSVGPGAATRSASGEEVETLRSLGYLTAGPADSSDVDRAFRQGPDPAQRIGVLGEINLGISLLDRGEPARAESVLAAVALSDPGNRFAYEFLGRARMAQGRLHAARDAWRRALALGPNQSTVYVELAAVEQSLGDLDAATLLLEEALRVDPFSALPRRELSRLLFQRGRLTEAAALLEEAARIQPRATDVKLGLATLYEATGRPDDALAQWTRVLELDSDGPEADEARAGLARVRAASEGGVP